jgi:DNA ligase-1
MSEIKKPMLAETCDDVTTLRFPVLATPKLDGIRCLVVGGKALSRKFKEIPNRYIQRLVSQLPEGLDGELMLRHRMDEGIPTFQKVTSAVMSEDGEPNFLYYVFDYAPDSLKTSYQQRMDNLAQLKFPEFVQLVLPTLIPNLTELREYESRVLSQGYEGVMVRLPDGPYKCGRSTVREGYLLKIKRFKDSEAEIIGFEERMHNNNEAKLDELGHTKRSSHKENLVPAGMLGAFIVRDVKTGLEFSIGTGYDDEFRKKVWENPYRYVRKLVKYKYQEVGQKDLPRFPVFLGFRDERDL